MSMLLENGANVNEKNENGCTALHTVAESGHETFVKLLLNRGASIDETDEAGRTALLCAAYFEHKIVVQLLLSHGASIIGKDEAGHTALLLPPNQDRLKWWSCWWNMERTSQRQIPMDVQHCI